MTLTQKLHRYAAKLEHKPEWFMNAEEKLARVNKIIAAREGRRNKMLWVWRYARQFDQFGDVK